MAAIPHRSQSESPDNYRLASPLSHLDENDPPCLFITGGNDDPSTHAKLFRRRMTELNLPADIIVIPDAPHGFLNKQLWFDQMIEATDRFFKKSLRPPSL